MYKPDNKDMKILDVLKSHADYTTRQIAKKTLLPITTVHNRIRKLKRERIIRKFTVDVDPESVGKGLAAYILVTADLTLLKRSKKSQHDLAEEISRLYFVERADIVSGGTDIVAVIRVKDVSELDKALLGKLQLIEGVESTRSLIVMHEA